MLPPDRPPTTGATRCRACGYDLSAASGDLCPECAAPVAWSTEGYRFANADPKFTARLRAGAAVSLAAPALLLSALVIGSDRIMGDLRPHAAIPLITALASLGIMAIGVWLLLTSDPGEPRAARRPQLLKLGRAAAITLALTPPLGAALQLITGGLSDAVGATFIGLALALLSATMFAVATRLATLTTRLDDPRLQNNAARRRWFAPATIAALAVAIAWPGAINPPQPPPMLLFTILPLLAIAGLVMFFATIARFRAALTHALRPACNMAARPSTYHPR